MSIFGTLSFAGQFQGLYASTQSYNVGMVVAFNGGAYLSLVGNNKNNEPDTSPTFWQPVASEVLQGPTGSQGPQGIPGAQGADGPVGPIGAAGSPGTPTVVVSTSYLDVISPMPAVTLFTPLTDSTFIWYMALDYGTQTGSGVLIPTLSFTNSFGAVENIGSGSPPFMFRARGGTPISFSIPLEGGGGGAAPVNVFITLGQF